MSTTTFLVRKDKLSTTRLRTGPDEPRGDGCIHVQVDSFALTSNNITYGVYGNAMDYWRFFPSGEDGWGIVPAWGFRTVLQSQHPDVAIGGRLYGYWPMANAVVLQPDRLTPSGFVDVAAHRKGTVAAPSTLSTAPIPKVCKHC